jgi:hypothetical protein
MDDLTPRVMTDVEIQREHHEQAMLAARQHVLAAPADCTEACARTHADLHTWHQRVVAECDA